MKNYTEPQRFIREKIAKQRYNAQTVRGIGWEINSWRLEQDVLANPYCQLSGEPLEFEPNYVYSFSIDRIDSNKSYTHDNVQWVGVSVNTAKNSLTDEQFIDMCVSVARHQGYVVYKPQTQLELFETGKYESS